MELSELKIMWDSQNQEPLYAMNQAALHAIVQRRNQQRDRCLACSFAAEITVGLFCGVLMWAGAGLLLFGEPTWLATLPWIKIAAFRWDATALLVAGGIWFYYSMYMFLAQRRQRKRVEMFDASLRGDLERAHSQTEFQIAMARNIVWWGLIPVWIATALWVVVLLHLKDLPAWSYLLMGFIVIGALIAVIASKQRSITRRFQPRLRELESLQTKLTDPLR